MEVKSCKEVSFPFFYGLCMQKLGPMVTTALVLDILTVYKVADKVGKVPLHGQFRHELAPSRMAHNCLVANGGLCLCDLWIGASHGKRNYECSFLFCFLSLSCSLLPPFLFPPFTLSISAALKSIHVGLTASILL